MTENIISSITYDPKHDSNIIFSQALKNKAALITDNELTLLQTELCEARPIKESYELVRDDFLESQELESRIRKTGIWEKSPAEVIEEIRNIKKDLVGFELKEENIYNGLYDFVVILIPQTHAVRKQVSEKNAKYEYSKEAIESQDNIYQTLKNLRKKNISAVNAWEEFRTEGHPNYDPAISGTYAKDINKKYNSLDRIMLDQIKSDKVDDQFLNYMIESATKESHPVYDEFIRIREMAVANIKDHPKKYKKMKTVPKKDLISWGYTLKFQEKLKDLGIPLPFDLDSADAFPSSDIFEVFLLTEDVFSIETAPTQEESEIRNRAISANLFNLAKNTGTNAINLILGAGHFDPEKMETIQSMLEDFGISYVLLTPKG